jgi:hypothetical protein
MDSAQDLQNLLSQYCGGDQVYFHSMNKRFNYTEGMRAVFEHAGGGARWLGDIFAFEPAIAKGVMQHGFAVALLQVQQGKATLTVSKDMDEQPLSEGAVVYLPTDVFFTQNIPVTDFPEGGWKFYLAYTMVGDKEVVLAMLPREY